MQQLRMMQMVRMVGALLAEAAVERREQQRVHGDAAGMAVAQHFEVEATRHQRGSLRTGAAGRGPRLASWTGEPRPHACAGRLAGV